MRPSVFMRLRSIAVFSIGMAGMGSGMLPAKASDALREYDATLVRQLHPATFIARDTRCAYHYLDTLQAALDGHAMKLGFRRDLPFNVHVVVKSAPIYGNAEGVVSLQRQASPGAPKNCDVYTYTRTQDGFLTGISFGNAAGGVFITSDTGTEIPFSVSMIDARKVRLDGRPLPICTQWPQMPCSAMTDYSAHKRVRVSYRVRMTPTGRVVELLSIKTLN